MHLSGPAGDGWIAEGLRLARIKRLIAGDTVDPYGPLRGFRCARRENVLPSEESHDEKYVDRGCKGGISARKRGTARRLVRLDVGRQMGKIGNIDQGFRGFAVGQVRLFERCKGFACVGIVREQAVDLVDFRRCQQAVGIGQ